MDETFGKLVEEVREHRSKMPICPSAQNSVDVPAIMREFCEVEFYRDDYRAITNYFTTDYVNHIPYIFLF